MATEHSCYTWDPVTQAWVHERGPEIPPPPAPPDVHALQSYFFDEDSKTWIRTVLAPMGRELAAKWQGAHKIPEDALKTARAVAKPKELKKKGGSPVGIIVIAVVLLVALGGIGVLASQNGMLSQVASSGVAPLVRDATPAPSVVEASASPSPSTSPSATTAPGGGGGGGVVRTNPPAGPQITAPPGALAAKLPDGTIVYYTGPTAVNKNQNLATSFVVVTAAGRPAQGVIVVILGDQRGSTQGQGGLDSQGRAFVQVFASQLTGQYPLSVLYNNQLAQITLIAVR